MTKYSARTNRGIQWKCDVGEPWSAIYKFGGRYHNYVAFVQLLGSSFHNDLGLLQHLIVERVSDGKLEYDMLRENVFHAADDVFRFGFRQWHYQKNFCRDLTMRKSSSIQCTTQTWGG
jgi:hypothetical protein